MSDGSNIGWTQATWSPVTGCDKISPGCGLPRFDGDDTGGCYAMALAKRLKAMGQAKYQNDGDPRTSGPGFGVTVHPGALDIPLRWRKPRRVFVNSMSDLFHARVPDAFIASVFGVMAVTPQHNYQVLTKRPRRMRALLASDAFRCQCDATADAAADAGNLWADSLDPMPWPLPNVWLGTSIELDRYAWRADELRETPAAIRFLSLEPLLGPLPSLNLDGISWTIIGGESGPDTRAMDIGWVREIASQCRDAGVAVFVKQDSGPRPGHQGHIPDDLWALKEFPRTAEAVTAP